MASMECRRFVVVMATATDHTGPFRTGPDRRQRPAPYLAGGTVEAVGYAGPPPTTPPPPGWRPPVVIEPAPPRELPPQDHAALDAAERAARRFTGAFAFAAGVVALFVACLLAGRLLA